VTVPGFLCKSQDVFQISILPEVVATASGGKTVCVKEPINLEASPVGDDFDYQWFGPNSFNSIQQNPFIRSANAVHEGIYSVTVTNTVTGCSGVDTTYIKVVDASLTLLDITKTQTIPLGSSIQLDAGNGSLYTWTPNDGSLNNPNINNPIATPFATTVYTVMAVDSNGCIDTASVLIEVSTDDDVFVPSGFTPNADGKNDVFRVVNLGKHKMVMMSVFNRWGEQIFRADDGSNLGWDGTQNGKPADMGTFNYIIILGKPDGTNKTITGTVTLIR
jgi:gliding motility-associated-like protein